MRECADHGPGVVVAVPGPQLRLEVLPLATALDDGSRHRLREVLPHHAAGRRRLAGLAGVGVDQPVVLVEGGMCHSPLAFTDTRHLVLDDETPGGELGRHDRGRVAAKVEHVSRPGPIQTRRVVGPYRTGRVRLVGPIAVGVEILRSVQNPPERLQGRALGTALPGFEDLALGVEVDLARDGTGVDVEKIPRTFHCFVETDAQMVHAVHKPGGGNVAGERVVRREKVGVVAMGGRIEDLVAVRGADAAEFAVMSREGIHGSRLEAVSDRARVTGAGEGGAGEPFMFTVLAGAVDRAERRGGGRRCQVDRHDQGSNHARPASSHLGASLAIGGESSRAPRRRSRVPVRDIAAETGG